MIYVTYNMSSKVRIPVKVLHYKQRIILWAWSYKYSTVWVNVGGDSCFIDSLTRWLIYIALIKKSRKFFFTIQHSHTAPLASIYARANSAQRTVHILPGTLELERVTQLCHGQNLLRKPAMEIKVHIFHSSEMHLERVKRSSCGQNFLYSWKPEK